MKTTFACLLQCFTHYIHAKTIYFDIHLNTADTVTGSCHFKVHITQVIFITKDIGKYRELTVLADQSHRHTGNVFRNGNTGIHQCK